MILYDHMCTQKLRDIKYLFTDKLTVANNLQDCKRAKMTAPLYLLTLRRYTNAILLLFIYYHYK